MRRKENAGSLSGGITPLARRPLADPQVSRVGGGRFPRGVFGNHRKPLRAFHPNDAPADVSVATTSSYHGGDIS
jgi:hypothetical protein